MELRAVYERVAAELSSQQTRRNRELADAFAAISQRINETQTDAETTATHIATQGLPPIPQSELWAPLKLALSPSAALHARARELALEAINNLISFGFIRGGNIFFSENVAAPCPGITESVEQNVTQEPSAQILDANSDQNLALTSSTCCEEILSKSILSLENLHSSLHPASASNFFSGVDTKPNIVPIPSPLAEIVFPSREATSVAVPPVSAPACTSFSNPAACPNLLNPISPIAIVSADATNPVNLNHESPVQPSSADSANRRIMTGGASRSNEQANSDSLQAHQDILLQAPFALSSMIDNAKTVAFADSMPATGSDVLSDIVQTVSACLSTTSTATTSALAEEAVQVRALRLLLNLCTTSNVRYTSLLRALQGCYNVFLHARGKNVVPVARASISQIVAHVVTRYIADPFDMHSVQFGASEQKDSTNDKKTLEKTNFINNAGANLRDLDVTIRALCKLTCRNFPSEPNTANILTESSTTYRCKLLSIDLLLSLLRQIAPSLREDSMLQSLLTSVASEIGLVVATNALAGPMPLFESSLAIFSLMVTNFPGIFRNQISVLLCDIYVPILTGSTFPLVQKTALLNCFVAIFSTPRLFLELYVNYDCQLSMPSCISDVISACGHAYSQNIPAAASVFEIFITSLATWTTQHPSFFSPVFSTALSTSSTVDSSNKTSLATTPSANANLCGESGIAAVCKTTQSQADELKQEGQEISAIDTNSSASDTVTANSLQECTNTELNTAQKDSEASTRNDFLVHTVSCSNEENILQKKQLIRAGVDHFNACPKRGILFLEAYDIIEKNSSRSLAQFLLTNEINKAVLGEFLGEEENTAVMHAYVDLLDFNNTSFMTALRRFLSGFKLPGESQKIDRFMERFSDKYCADNPGVFTQPDTAYGLAFSIIMLNTDLHSAQVRRRMTVDDYIKNNRGIDMSKDLSDSFLAQVYDDIKTNEIQLDQETSSSSNNINVTLRPKDPNLFIVTKNNNGNSMASNSVSAPVSSNNNGGINNSNNINNTGSNSRSGSSNANNDAPEESYGSSSDLTAFYEVSSRESIAILKRSQKKILATKDLEVAVWKSAELLDYSRLILQSAHGVLLPCLFQMRCLPALRAGATLAVRFGLPLETLEYVSAFAILSGLWLPPLSRNTPTTDQVESASSSPLKPTSQAHPTNSVRPWQSPIVTKFCTLAPSVVGTAPDITAMQHLLQLANTMGSNLRDSWEIILSCISELDRLPASLTRNEITVQTDCLFAATANLPLQALLAFILGLCRVSAYEVSTQARSFLLRRLVEISHYNVGRVRYEVNLILRPVLEHFVEVVRLTCSQQTAATVDKSADTASLVLAEFAVDSLRQIITKHLDRCELAHHNTQQELMRPFLVLVETPEVQELALHAILQLVQTRAKNIRAGWRIIFEALRKARGASTVSSILLALRQHHAELQASGSLSDYVSCLSDACLECNDLVLIEALSELRVCRIQVVNALLCIVQHHADDQCRQIAAQAYFEHLRQSCAPVSNTEINGSPTQGHPAGNASDQAGTAVATLVAPVLSIGQVIDFATRGLTENQRADAVWVLMLKEFLRLWMYYESTRGLAMLKASSLQPSAGSVATSASNSSSGNSVGATGNLVSASTASPTVCTVSNINSTFTNTNSAAANTNSAGVSAFSNSPSVAATSQVHYSPGSVVVQPSLSQTPVLSGPSSSVTANTSSGNSQLTTLRTTNISSNLATSAGGLKSGILLLSGLCNVIVLSSTIRDDAVSESSMFCLHEILQFLLNLTNSVVPFITQIVPSQCITELSQRWELLGQTVVRLLQNSIPSEIATTIASSLGQTEDSKISFANVVAKCNVHLSVLASLDPVLQRSGPGVPQVFYDLVLPWLRRSHDHAALFNADVDLQLQLSRVCEALQINIKPIRLIEHEFIAKRNILQLLVCKATWFSGQSLRSLTELAEALIDEYTEAPLEPSNPRYGLSNVVALLFIKMGTLVPWIQGAKTLSTPLPHAQQTSQQPQGQQQGLHQEYEVQKIEEPQQTPILQTQHLQKQENEAKQQQNCISGPDMARTDCKNFEISASESVNVKQRVAAENGSGHAEEKNALQSNEPMTTASVSLIKNIFHRALAGPAKDNNIVVRNAAISFIECVSTRIFEPLWPTAESVAVTTTTSCAPQPQLYTGAQPSAKVAGPASSSCSSCLPNSVVITDKLTPQPSSSNSTSSCLASNSPAI